MKNYKSIHNIHNKGAESEIFGHAICQFLDESIAFLMGALCWEPNRQQIGGSRESVCYWGNYIII